jgi:hypothetical protein
MKAKQYILYALFAALFLACENELDVQPRQREDATVSLGTEKGVKDILSGTYAIAANGDVYGGRILVAADLLGQTGTTATTELRWRGTFAEFRHMYAKTMLVNNVFVQQIWARNYEIINAANTVIENISKVSSPEDQKRMIGEANFLKSLAYFDLVRFFGKQYEAGKNNTQLGVIIREKAINDYTIDLSAERSSVEAVYALVIDGLNKAYNDLPVENEFYANKYAAKALLARVYLQMQNYPAARDAANDVILNSGADLSTKYADAFNHDSNQIEDIFAIQITKQTGDNQVVNLYASEANGGRGGDIEITSNYLNKFDDSNDDRRNFNKINPANNRRLTSKYTSQFGDVPIIRYAEMLLIRAEANFRESTSVGDTPLKDINRLRTRANATNFTSTSLNLSIILRERELELGMEGFKIHDIKRTGGNVTSSLPWISDKLIFPIPLRETDSNKKITQNTGYF